jgi:phosphate:Na+ symporter
LLGSVALLLWGSRMVRTGVMRAYGGDLRRIIGQALRHRLAAFAAGLGVTGILQSSTATALITASFAERGLMATAPALAVMLGADVGTSLVVQALSFRLDWLSPLFVLIGVVTFMAGKSSRHRDLGRASIGLGLMLLALHSIVATTEPIRSSAVLETMLGALAGEPLMALAVAAGLTWLAHSSVAIILLIVSLAVAGLIPLGLAVIFTLGANLGGAIPPVLATWRGEVSARRVTLGNLGFRLIGCLLVLPFVGLVLPELTAFDPDPGRAVANFHTAFNLALAALFLPLVGPAAQLVQRLLPDRIAADEPSKPRYLDETALGTPPLAIAAAARETLRMGDTLERMLRDTLKVFETDDRNLAAQVSKNDDIVDRLHEAIKLYLTQVSQENMGEAESRRSMEIIAFTTNLEHVGDIIDKNLIELATKKIKNRLRFSEEGSRDIYALYGQVLDTIKLALAVFIGGDIRMARQLLEQKVRFRDREREAADRHLDRLRSGRTESIETSSLHLDILRDLKRINSHLTSVAYPILEQTGELRASRLKGAEGEAYRPNGEPAARPS